MTAADPSSSARGDEPHEFVKTWLDTCAVCGQGIEEADFPLHGWDEDDA